MQPTGPQNGIMGDAHPTELPQAVQTDDQLKEERAMASFTKTEEFKRLKDHLEQRIAYYQQFLPDGTPVVGTDLKKAQEMWVPANIIIQEMRAILGSYELAKEVVTEANGK